MTHQQLRVIAKEITAIPEKSRLDPAKKEKLRKVHLQNPDNFLAKNSGFVPPKKQGKNKPQDTSDSSVSFSEAGSSRSQRTSATRSSSNNSRTSRSSRTSSNGSHQACRNHAHDERGHCILQPGVAVDHSRRKKRLLGVKPARCNTAADGLFRGAKPKPKVRGLERSKTR